MTDALVLLSGGIDSAACLRFYLLQSFSVTSLFVEYGQVSASKESRASKEIADFYNVPFRKVVMKNTVKHENGGYILGRNAFLLLTGLLNFQKSNGIIALGIHSGTNYPDCSHTFIDGIQAVFDEYTDGRIKIGTPFISFTKLEIWNFCHKEDIPVELTYSCELGKQQPCKECNSCKDLKALYEFKESNNRASLWSGN